MCQLPFREVVRVWRDPAWQLREPVQQLGALVGEDSGGHHVSQCKLVGGGEVGLEGVQGEIRHDADDPSRPSPLPASLSGIAVGGVGVVKT